MAMLAEPRRKQKWTLNPQGKYWSDDSNKFGQKLLEKMGWSKGKGLGVNEQGITEHVKAIFKNDKIGMGYDKNSDTAWIEQQDQFNDLLKQLQENQETITKSESEDNVLSSQSLESKAKQSRTRIYYTKFTRNKDVKKYNSKDLANIFGQKELTDKTAVEIEKNNSIDEKETIGTKDNWGGVVTINSGSINDYFKNKLSNYSKSLSYNVDDKKTDSESETEQRLGFGFASKMDTDNSFKKSVKEKRKKDISLHTNKIDDCNAKTRLKTDVDNNCKGGFTNPALNLDTEVNENYSGKEFEVPRVQFGLENCGLDLTDENQDKKRVTFNDHVEYNTDSMKKKKKKATLDKFEVENKKHKKKRKHEDITTSVSTGIVNEALEVEILSEEINDNESNERKSRKIKRRKICKTSNLETIQESPEREEQIIEIDVEPEVVVLDTDMQIEETDTTKDTHKKSKKKHKKKKKFEDILIDIKNKISDTENQNTIKHEKNKMEKNKEEEIVFTKLKKKKNKEEEIASTKLKKKKKKDRDVEIMEDTLETETNNVQQDIIILEKQNTNQMQQSNDLTEKTIEDTEQRKIKKKKKHKKNHLKNEEVLTLSDTEKEFLNSNVSSTSFDHKHKKKCKKSKKDNMLDISYIDNLSTSETSFVTNKEITNLNDNIKQEKNTQSVDIPSTSNKVEINQSQLENETIKHKNLFKMLENLEVDFPGSNINEIEGYGVKATRIHAYS